MLVAADLLDDGHLPDAASKIYYAIFDVTESLMVSDGIPVVRYLFLNDTLLISQYKFIP